MSFAQTMDLIIFHQKEEVIDKYTVLQRKMHRLCNCVAIVLLNVITLIYVTGQSCPVN